MAFSAERAVCTQCVGDSMLAAEMKNTGARRRCQICGMKRIGVDLRVVMERVDEVYRTFFSEGAYWGELGQQGDYPEEIVGQLLGCDHDLAEWIVDQLASEESRSVVHDGAGAMYDTGTKYEALEAEPWYEWSLWRQFEEHIKHERRFFGRDGLKLLSELLGDLPALVQRFQINSTIVVDPEDAEAPTVFRARVGGGPGKADDIYRQAPRSLGPPPLDQNVGGRMHAAGISAFYASFSRETCTRELRPHVGEEVVSAEFRVKRPIRLLNLPAFSELEPDISRFDPEYYGTTTRLLFLRSFHEVVSRPVFPTRELLDYVPTQAVAEFLVSEMDVDGLVFAPAQGRYAEVDPCLRLKNNVVLFSAPFLSSDELSHRTFGRPPGVAGEIYDLIEPPRTEPEPCLEMVPGSVEICEVTAVHVDTQSRLPRKWLYDADAGDS